MPYRWLHPAERAMTSKRERARKPNPSALKAGYGRFWSEVGSSFPDLEGAASTEYYLDNERGLLQEHLPHLQRLRIFKTDLWDEARNTRILRWAAEQGAQTYGIDISPPTTQLALGAFAEHGLSLGGAVSDVRRIPFRDASFDAVYSMGTIEHFEETEVAMGEIFRVLRPGGRAIIGVPNRWDPFLRPLLVTVLHQLGLYSYGYEKSFSRRALRRMCQRTGFEVVAETGILFIPGWLRMLDLAFHTWCRPLSRFTGLAVRPFAWLYRRFPGLRRHGYLITAVAVRPDSG
jgi:SAM-dependent methyltransferase